MRKAVIERTNCIIIVKQLPKRDLFFHSDAFDFEFGVVIVRISQGLDISAVLQAQGK